MKKRIKLKLGYFYYINNVVGAAVCEDRLKYFFEIDNKDEIYIILSTTEFKESYKLIVENPYSNTRPITLKVKNGTYREVLTPEADEYIAKFMEINKVNEIYVGVEYD